MAELRADPVTVIVGGSYWALNGVNVFSANLVRGLRAMDVEAHVLLTEEHSALIRINDARMRRPDDVPFVELPVEPWRSWGGHWGAMIRYLEDRAPCVYIPNSDWRHSCVSPLLSDEVRVIGVVHSDDALHYDHVARLGKYWDAITTTSRTIARKTLALDETLAPRLEVIPIGVDIPLAPPVRPERPGGILKIIYPGSLKQHQKRVLDLPRIVEAAARRQIQVSLTIAGGGPDEERLRQACAPLVDRGLITFLGVVEHGRLLALLEEHDVFILTSEFEGMPNALLEAMGRGCVPLVTDMESAVPELVRDGVSGHIVRIGDIDAFADRLRRLCDDPDGRQQMARRAHEAVSAGRFRVQDMVAAYADLARRVMDRSHHTRYRRPRGRLSHPPAEVAGVKLFPVDLPYEAPDVGRLPDETRDYREFVDELRRVKRPEQSPLRSLIAQAPAPPDLTRLEGVEVVVATPAWTRSSINVFAANLVRELRSLGVSAHILLTEEATERVAQSAPRLPSPSDVPFVRLPVEPSDSWGAHWGAMVRYLEERAPCIYLPNDDWRHSCVSPLLSKRVAVVGIVHQDSPLHYDHAGRLAASWHAIVAPNRTIAARVRALDEAVDERLTVIPFGVRLPDAMPEHVRDPEAPLNVLCPAPLGDEECRFLRALAAALRERAAPVALTVIAVGGTDSATPPLTELGVRLLDPLPQNEAWTELERQDVILMISRFAGDWETLAEAIGEGCVPVLLEGPRLGELGGGLVQDGYSGYTVSGGALETLPDRLATLHGDRSARHRMALAAYHLVRLGSPSSRDMARDYAAVFIRALGEARRTSRPGSRTTLVHAPARIGDVDLFPVQPGLEMPDYSPFVDRSRTLNGSPRPERLPPPEDVEHGPLVLAGEEAGPGRSQTRAAPAEALENVQVIVASPAWTPIGVNEFSARLVRELLARGVPAQVLLTEEETDRVDLPGPRMARPDDVPFHLLPVARADSWGGHWGAMIRYLEERAPCIYIPNHDWRHSCVSPLLSDAVAVVGIVHGDDALHDEHVRRLGRYWNAVVTRDHRIGRKVAEDQALPNRLFTVLDDRTDFVDCWLRIFERVMGDLRTGAFRRPRGPLCPPPPVVEGMSIFPVELSFEKAGIGRFSQRDPDYAQFEEQIRMIRPGRT